MMMMYASRCSTMQHTAPHPVWTPWDAYIDRRRLRLPRTNSKNRDDGQRGLTEVLAADVVDERVAAAADEDERLRDDVGNDVPRGRQLADPLDHLLRRHQLAHATVTARFWHSHVFDTVIMGLFPVGMQWRNNRLCIELWVFFDAYGIEINCHFWTISVSGSSRDYRKVAKIRN